MRKTTQYYRIADFVIAIEGNEHLFTQLPNFAPFRVDETDETKMFIIRVTDESIPSNEHLQSVYTDRSDDDMPRIEIYENEQTTVFAVSQYRDSEIVCAIHCTKDMREATLYTSKPYFRFAIDNATMLLYAFCSTPHKTLLFHSSVIVKDGLAYMFLGYSGTGKSTHSRQWLAAYPQAWLLNDDNPIVRILPDGIVRVYGSPWSGKTPCYKAESAPVQALIQLAQAPQNRTERLRMTHAYPYILASVSGLKTQPKAMDHLYESIAELLEAAPVYKLECLPNVAAAHVCYEACSAISR